MTKQPWNLVADIGGTNARFAASGPERGARLLARSYSVADFPRLADAVTRFLKEVAASGGDDFPGSVCLALACPITGDELSFTNSPWQVDRRRLSALLGGAAVTLINDFEAVGYAVSELGPQDWVTLGGGEPVAGAPVGVLGPGTGLGVCTLVPVDDRYLVLEGEGGHVDFAPVTATEIEVLRVLIERYGRVSVERLLSGAGIVNIYLALGTINGATARHGTPPEVVEAGLASTDPLAREALAMFCRVLGSVAGNLALTAGTRGGIYIAGGIVPRFIDFVRDSDFMTRFRAKGRFESYLAPIPVRVITRSDLGLLGAEKKLILQTPQALKEAP